MDPAARIALSVTHFNRLPLLLECLAYPLTDPRIGEITICDDASTDGSWEKMQLLLNHPKVRLFRNVRNLDCYANKAQVLQHTALPWTILLDSDNVIDKTYLDTLYALPAWDPRTLYAPVFAQPLFDYRVFAGKTVSCQNVGQMSGGQVVYATIPHPRTGRPILQGRRNKYGSLFLTALNTANYFVFRVDYLSVWDSKTEPYTADSIYQAYNWLKSGRQFYFVPGLYYQHRIHPGSHYKLNCHKTGNFRQQIEQKLTQLK